ncbi:MAG: hypothetical protein ABGZ17_26045, partial [Planctomycetaceae bacterium]
FAAAQAITQQLQRGKPLLDPTLGWRPFPDPEILSQIARFCTLQGALSREALYQRYSDRELKKRRDKEGRRGDTWRTCCNETVITALSRTAFECDEQGCFLEASDRIRSAAERAILLCVDEFTTHSVPTPPSDPDADPNVTPPMTTPSDPNNTQQNPVDFLATQGPGRLRRGGYIPGTGRADMTNRLNIFDNMSVEPLSKAWYGFQVVKTANTGVALSDQSNQLFDLLNNEDGRALFISFTGFGRQQGGPIVSPYDPASAETLKNLYLSDENNGGRGTSFLERPDMQLHRLGFEHALTPDFSFGIQAQFIDSLDDVGQPDFWGNPQIFMKHVLFRDEMNTLTGVLSISPQVPIPRFSIAEKTTRINPGLLFYHQIDEDWFLIGGGGVSLPTTDDQITTLDYGLSLSYWLYRHESLEPYYRGPEQTTWLMAIVPHVEVFGKQVLGNNTRTDFFNLSSSQPQTAPGTVSPLDGTTNVYLPGTNQLVSQTTFFFEEPEHVVDMTASVTFLLGRKWQFSTGVSVPVTGGAAREFEYIGMLNYLY